MGLDFSHGSAHWSYSGFHRFRQRLAEMQGHQIEEFFRGRHSENPLYPLLHHSDCDGELSPAECERIAPALKAVLEKWMPDDYDRQHGLLLVEAMEECARTKKPLRFT